MEISRGTSTRRPELLSSHDDRLALTANVQNKLQEVRSHGSVPGKYKENQRKPLLLSFKCKTSAQLEHSRGTRVPERIMSSPSRRGWSFNIWYDPVWQP